jgi:ABC-type branched-subunit amino acid transport system ATPase component
VLSASPETAPPILEVAGLSKSFGGLKALSDVSFAVTPGSVIALIGPNGAGKTTALNLISGLDTPSAGRVRFEGRDITRLGPDRRVALGMSRTFQVSSLLKGITVVENVLVGTHLTFRTGFWSAVLTLPRQRAEERRAAEASMELLRFFGIESAAQKTMSELPYGQQRKVQLARALATDPRLLLLDEISAGLNPREVEDLEESLHDVRKRGVTLLVIEHNVPLVRRIADRVVVLRFGRKIAEGTPDEIAEHREVLEHFLGTGAAGA